MENEFQYNDPIVITIDVANFMVPKVFVDNESFLDIIFLHVLHHMKLDLTILQHVRTPLLGFRGSEIIPLGTIDLPTLIGNDPYRRTLMIN